MSTADAVARETAWLRTSGDGLPALLKTVGGPFDDVQAYFPGTFATQRYSLFVLRRHTGMSRFANVRTMPKYAFHLVCWWPLLDGQGSAEADQSGLDNAVELVLQRVCGQLLDKTHGGRFLSVAENPRQIDVTYPDVEQTIPLGYIRADITYSADDPETNN